LANKERTLLGRVWSIVKILSTIAVIVIATSFGALHGWHNHGLVGALALGFVGLVAGALLSRSSMILEFLPGGR
jgi:ABC-type polysaccharide/polyol phosphate export permease